MVVPRFNETGRITSINHTGGKKNETPCRCKNHKRYEYTGNGKKTFIFEKIETEQEIKLEGDKSLMLTHCSPVFL